MASIRGRYVYDDDDLTPGQKREGGLHQNLYDSDGKLRASARFIPDEGNEPDTIYVYVDQDYSTERSKVDDELVEAMSRLVSILIEAAQPHVKRFWDERALPAIKERWDKRPRGRGAARRAPADDPAAVEATVVDSSEEVLVASEEYRTNMSSAEAQARYLLALAAKAFSDEQMRIVSNANIEDDEGFTELQRALAELPPRQVALIIEKLEANPSLLTDPRSDLGRILGVGHTEDDYLPIEEHREE